MNTSKTIYMKPGLLMTELGVIMLCTPFTVESIAPIACRIIEYNLLPEANRPKEIKLMINSPGGDMAAAFQLIDTMMSSEIPVRTIGQGTVASCGVLTLMSGKKGTRTISSTASVMSHQYSWGSRGKEHELEAANVEFGLTSARMMLHYRKCTGKSETYIRKHLLGPSDMWLTPEECVKHGIADSISNPY